MYIYSATTLWDNYLIFIVYDRREKIRCIRVLEEHPLKIHITTHLQYNNNGPKLKVLQGRHSHGNHYKLTI